LEIGRGLSNYRLARCWYPDWTDDLALTSRFAAKGLCIEFTLGRAAGLEATLVAGLAATRLIRAVQSAVFVPIYNN